MRILDAFTERAANLQRELDARKQQYEHYRDEVIQRLCPDGVEYKPLQSVCQKTQNIKWANTEGIEFEYIDLSSVDIATRSIICTTTVCADTAPSRAQQLVKEGDVLFATTRPTQMRLCSVPSRLDGQVCSTGYCVLRASEDICSSYLFHLLGSARLKSFLERNQTMGNYPSIPNKTLLEYEIPVPPIGVQQEIVRILDAFTELEANLQRELAARKQQYEHYRDALLDLPRKES